mmetsp:Transcript_50867/g.142366  ORF Transcript_50867/g.142366 Transcript_50867/m.142366 type:complete len:204 (-) Transcript_50867:257-868(-)
MGCRHRGLCPAVKRGLPRGWPTQGRGAGQQLPLRQPAYGERAEGQQRCHGLLHQVTAEILHGGAPVRRPTGLFGGFRGSGRRVHEHQSPAQLQLPEVLLLRGALVRRRRHCGQHVAHAQHRCPHAHRDCGLDGPGKALVEAGLLRCQVADNRRPEQRSVGVGRFSQDHLRFRQRQEGSRSEDVEIRPRVFRGDVHRLPLLLHR